MEVFGERNTTDDMYSCEYPRLYMRLKDSQRRPFLYIEAVNDETTRLPSSHTLTFLQKSGTAGSNTPRPVCSLPTHTVRQGWMHR